jgi:hypothetical protein
VQVARGTQQGEIDIIAGPSGMDGVMQDTQPIRDAIWRSFVFDMENILLGREDAARKRAEAIDQGLDPARAAAAYGRTPEEAQERFGIESLAISFSEGWSSFYIYLDRTRVDEADAFYKNIREVIPERAGVRVRGILYYFDYGDSWEFAVQLLTIDENEPLLKKPKIIEIKGEAPAQYEFYDEDEE